MPKNKYIRYVLIAAAGIAVFRVGIWLFGGSTGQEAQIGVAVETQILEKIPVNDARIFSGTLQSADKFIVSAKVAGLLRGLQVNIGDRIEKGQLIAWLDDQEFAQQVARAKAERDVAKARVAEARASLIITERDYQRIQQLRKQKIASESEFDLSLTKLNAERARSQVAEAQMDQAESLLKAAEIQASYTKILADWRGDDATRVVGQRFASEGASIRPYEPIISLTSRRPLNAIIQVSETDYSRIKEGQPAEITVESYPSQTFAAVIERRAPEFNEASRQAQVEISIKNEDELLTPGMYAKIRLVFQTFENATVVPFDAVVTRNNKTGVFLVDNSDSKQAKARFIAVKTGLRDGNVIQILEPAELAGQVVTLGQHLLSDNTPVRVAAKQPVESEKM